MSDAEKIKAITQILIQWKFGLSSKEALEEIEAIVTEGESKK